LRPRDPQGRAPPVRHLLATRRADARVRDYTTGEAAVLLGLRPSAIRSAIRRGRIVAERRGRDYLIPLAEIRAYELAHQGRVGRPPKFRKFGQA
jgi:excisionase family DNA binding protein